MMEAIETFHHEINMQGERLKMKTGGQEIKVATALVIMTLVLKALAIRLYFKRRHYS